MIDRSEIDRLRCEITTIPTRHYNHAARALLIAETLLQERDEALAHLESLERRGISDEPSINKGT